MTKMESRMKNVILLILVALIVIIYGLLFKVVPYNTVENDFFYFLFAIIACFSYYYDIKPYPSISFNADYVVIFPALYILKNPFIASTLPFIGFLLSRIFKRKKLTLGHLFDALQISLSFYISSITLIAIGGPMKVESLKWDLTLLGSMFIMLIINISFLSVYLIFVKKEGIIHVPNAVKSQITPLLSSFPLTLLIMLAFDSGSILILIFSLFPLGLILWTIHLLFLQNEKNALLIKLTREQEFLQQINMIMQGTIDPTNFYKKILDGIQEFVPFDCDAMLVSAESENVKPTVFSGKCPDIDGDRLREWFEEELNIGSIREARVVDKKEACFFLCGEKPNSTLIVPISTKEITFGVVLLERKSEPPFSDSEIAFVQNVLTQISKYLQDEVLKRQIFESNEQLKKRTAYLFRILEITNALKTHFDTDKILDLVAKSIREFMGFKTILISLLMDDGYFHRTAQAGLDNEWASIKEIKVPEGEIRKFLKNKYQISDSYLISHEEGELTEYDVIPMDMDVNVPEGHWHPLDALFVPLIDKDGNLLGVLSLDQPEDGKIPTEETIRSIEILANQAVHALESSNINAAIRRQAIIDGLTNLYNHTFLQERLVELIAQADEMNDTLGCLMMDIDNFKEVNDRFGHLIGDRILKTVGQTIHSCVRQEDVAARYGGDEFAILLPKRDKEACRAVAERIREANEKATTYLLDGKLSLKITISIGVAIYPEHGTDNRQLLENADKALYGAKSKGKNRVFVAA